MSASWREFSCEDIDFPVWISSEGEVRIGARVITKSNGRAVYSRVAPPRKLKQVKNTCGYFQIKIHSRGKARRFYVHRLVAALFSITRAIWLRFTILTAINPITKLETYVG